MPVGAVEQMNYDNDIPMKEGSSIDGPTMTVMIHGHAFT